MYIDYTFYKDIYGGSVPQEDFPKLNVQAQAKVDYFTMGRIPKLYPLPDSVKYAVCEVIDTIHEYNVTMATKTADNRRIASETTGSHSVTFKYGDEINKPYQVEASKAKTLNQRIYEVVATYLMNEQDLMYKGVVWM